MARMARADLVDPAEVAVYHCTGNQRRHPHFYTLRKTLSAVFWVL